MLEASKDTMLKYIGDAILKFSSTFHEVIQLIRKIDIQSEQCLVQYQCYYIWQV